MVGDNVVTVDTTELRKALNDFACNADNATTAHKVLGEILRRYVDDKFQSEGPGWAPLSPATIARRRVSERYQILQDTGVLAGSMVPDGGPDFAEVSTNVLYSVFHLAYSSHQSMRDFFDIDFDAALDECADEIMEYLTR